METSDPVIANQTDNTIQIFNLSSDNFTVEVYGILGERFIQKFNQTSFSLNELQSGTYVIVLSQGDQKTSKLIVVQK
jgi:hypothetical protein